MNLFKRKESKKQMKSDKQRKERIHKLASTNNTINYTSQYESGLMHIVNNEYSTCMKLGEVDYEVANEDEKLDIVVNYAEALNSLDKQSRYQLLVINKRTDSSIINDILLEYQADGFDDYRREMNDLILSRFNRDQNNFNVEKYAIFTTESNSPKQANRQLNTMIQNFEKRFNENGTELTFHKLEGIERLKLMASILRPKKYFTFKYSDLVLTHLTTRNFVSPTRINFKENYFELDEYYGQILYIREFPKYLEDHLIQEICKMGRELIISIHAKPYDLIEARNNIRNKQLLNKAEIVKQQKKNFVGGLSEDMLSGVSKEIEQTTSQLIEEMKDNGQKIFSGIFCVMLLEESKEQLTEAVRELKEVARTWQVEFDDVYKMQEEALNTILPIGKPYLDVEALYMRDLTTNNIVTQVPFSSVELNSSNGQYYGQNQLSKNMITVNRKEDLITPSGLVLGSSGSGKGMTVKWGLLSTLLKQKNDRVVIVDPESEYSPIGRTFKAQILDIFPGTKHHLNILDMADRSLLKEEDRHVDLVKEKANLLASLFESILKDFSDVEASLIDRVTRLTYEKVTEKNPTLVDWYYILKEQPEAIAEELALKVEPYTIGSQDIFAHKTNIDLNAKFVIFNIKQLDERLKPFAMKVILDQIWKQVVSNQGKVTTWLYFDELQLNFDTDENATWFMKLWSRVRKYGAIPTGITQNVSTLLERSAGKKMISNSEFIVLLRQKLVDLEYLSQVIKLPDNLLKFVGDRVTRGTGLISAGGIVVPFENEIPIDTKLFTLMNTDAGGGDE